MNIMKTINKIYNLRHKFSVLALTGVTGSGCSELAKMMSKPFADLKNQIRSIDDLKEGDNPKDFEVFKRKYQRAYRLLDNEYEKYRVISYKNAVVLETLILLAWKYDQKDLRANFKQVLKKNFKPSRTEPNYQYDKLVITDEMLDSWGYKDVEKLLLNEIPYLNSWDDDKNKWRTFVSEFFFGDKFTAFCDNLFEYLKTKDYYLKNFLVHRLGNSIRSFGDPLVEATHDSCKEANMDNLFTIIGLINDIIKGSSHENNRNFVIDSLRCSLEIVYLRERYNAFYMVSMHNDDCIGAIEQKVCAYDNANATKLAKHIHRLGLMEIKPGDYENGCFSVPDIYNCIANSEIHIFKRENSKEHQSYTDFYSTAEQWMKIQALLLHPGLFTPSSDERCMSIAFQVKYNSGCISRQVGCVITDKNYTIKSLGWNEVPVGQISCGLTDVDELLQENKDPQYRIYSRFEQEGTVVKKIQDENHNAQLIEKSFKNYMKDHYTQDKLREARNHGLYVPFCFKSCYNTFKEQRDNVNTRSLHAEENTMLQISKNGGIGLNEGKMYVTASPCVLCSKKAYQIGIREIIYLDKYTDIAADQILDAGFNKPILRGFCGIIGSTYFKLYQPFMSFKDELGIRFKK